MALAIKLKLVVLLVERKMGRPLEVEMETLLRDAANWSAEDKKSAKESLLRHALLPCSNAD